MVAVGVAAVLLLSLGVASWRFVLGIEQYDDYENLQSR